MAPESPDICALPRDAGAEPPLQDAFTLGIPALWRIYFGVTEGAKGFTNTLKEKVWEKKKKKKNFE